MRIVRYLYSFSSLNRKKKNYEKSVFPGYETISYMIYFLEISLPLVRVSIGRVKAAIVSPGQTVLNCKNN